MKAHIQWMILLMVSSLVMSGCFHKKNEDELQSQFDVKVLPVAPSDPYLDIVVAYVDNNNFSELPVPRLKLIKPAEYDATTGYKFLGRAYSKDYPGRNGFGIGVSEYFTNIGSYDYTSDGFKYLFGTTCQPVNYSITCPTVENKMKTEPVFYSYPMEYRAVGIIPLFEYDSPGGIGSGVSGIRGVSFTVNFQDIVGMQRIYGEIPYRVIGYIFHSTKEDRDTRLKSY